MSTARQRQPRAKHNSNDEQPDPPTRSSSATGISHRSNRYRRKRLPVTVVTVTSILLFLVFVLVRRVLVVVSPHTESLPVSSLPQLNDVQQSSILVLTAFLEPPDTLQSDLRLARKTSASLLTKVEYPQVSKCSLLTESWPIDNFPSDDPFLPWIHSIFPSQDGTSVKVVAQNKRRCHVGDNEKEDMKHWEPQIALLQPIPVTRIDGRYRLASPEKAMWKETRFLCHFHTSTQEFTTLSEFPFNYEYVSWRKKQDTMFEMVGKDTRQFWLSQLLFSCPIPNELQTLVRKGGHVTNDRSNLWMDLVPIRTPARYGEPLFTSDHVGKDLIKNMRIFNTTREWADEHVLPSLQDSGRWANIPICLPPPTPKHRLVACTWTAASYTRRGDAVTMSDNSLRLREWILFHQMVGFEQLYVYDNTVGKESPLREICNEFDICIYQKWPATVCNNNRPNHANPGERSSQYAAEATCRERYGPTTDWMAFIDTDEYLVPMKSDTWREVLDDMDARGMKILKMKSSRTKPRLEFMEVSPDQSTCVDPKRISKFEPEPCVVPRKNETFLRVYNCEFIKPPRPDRFERAMKQIYRPSHVWNHFVHYSTVTADVARLYKDFGPNETYISNVHSRAWEDASPEVFVDELNEGTLVHTKSVLPHETMYRSSICQLNSSSACALGFICPSHVEFFDEAHQKNIFKDDQGKYCNCWLNPRVEEAFTPKLKAALEEHSRKMGGR